MKKMIAVGVVLSFLLILISACSRSQGTTASASNSGANAANNSASTASNSVDVHLEGTSFDQSSVTISKGGTVNLINDTATVHIIQNGSWENGTAKSAVETGAPVVSGVQFSTMNQKQVVGPFTTAGTFNVYCTVHPGMNLTIIVQ
jgi:plastocyanin